MRVLFDIVHPADVLFFLHPIQALLADGNSVEIASREKDVTCALLDEFGLEHRPASAAGAGYLGLAKELAVRDLAILRRARARRPHVMVGFGGVAISHVGKLLGVPSVSFYDSDTAGLQTRLTWPFISHLYVPQAYSGAVPEGRTTRFSGVKELSYFHPDCFAADRAIAIANGLSEDRDNFLVRTVSWRANHDLGKSGWSDIELRALINHLSDRGQVHLSSERALPHDLENLRYAGDSSQLHHLMAHCRLYVGESATMAHEAAILGVPAIYDGTDHPVSTRELAHHGLVTALGQPGWNGLRAAVDVLLEREAMARHLAARSEYLASRERLSDYIVAALHRHASLEGARF